MATYGLKDRIEDNKKTWADYWNTLFEKLESGNLGTTLGVIAFGVLALGYLHEFHGVLAGLPLFDRLLTGLYTNVSSELLSVLITVLILDRLNAQRAKQERKRQLRILVGSRNDAVAVGALDELRAEDWLDDILQDDQTRLRGANWQNAHLPKIALARKDMERINLEGADLRFANLAGAHLWVAHLTGVNLQYANLADADLFNANLEDADLQHANLADADLVGVNLAGAHLVGVNLAGAFLRDANLAGAHLWVAHLTGVNLQYANLAGAHLIRVNLAGADLSSANLEHANLYGVTCDENTTLPDGSTWTENTDWTKYGAVQIEGWDEWLAYLYQHDLLRQHLSRLSDVTYEKQIQWLRDEGYID